MKNYLAVKWILAKIRKIINFSEINAFTSFYSFFMYSFGDDVMTNVYNEM